MWRMPALICTIPKGQTMPTDTSAKISIFKRRESEARSYCRSFDTVFTRAQGSELTDSQGRTYIDFLVAAPR